MREVDGSGYDHPVRCWSRLIGAYQNDSDAVALAEGNGSCWIVHRWICALWRSYVPLCGTAEVGRPDCQCPIGSSSFAVWSDEAFGSRESFPEQGEPQVQFESIYGPLGGRSWFHKPREFLLLQSYEGRNVAW